MFGFVSPANADLWQQRWREAKLETPKDWKNSFHPDFTGGLIRRLYSTKETWVDTSQLANALITEEMKNLIFQATVQNIEYESKNAKITRVDTIINNKEFVFEPRRVVFAAGEGNFYLLKMLDAKILLRAQERQQIRQSQMLVVQGNQLKEYSLIVPDLSLFMVSRPKHSTSANSSEVTCLVSSDVDEVIIKHENPKPSPIPTRVRDTIFTLSALLPSIFNRSKYEKFKWGAYIGYKAETVREGRIIPNEWTVETFGTDSFYAVWPTKLTLAPEASQYVLLDLIGSFPPPRNCFQPQGLPEPQNWALGIELWRRQTLQSWHDFSLKYSLNDL
jgi:hypothetical protein